MARATALVKMPLPRRSIAPRREPSALGTARSAPNADPLRPKRSLSDGDLESFVLQDVHPLHRPVKGDRIRAEPRSSCSRIQRSSSADALSSKTRPIIQRSASNEGTGTRDGLRSSGVRQKDVLRSDTPKVKQAIYEEEQIAELEFHRMDINGDSRLSFAELLAGLSRIGYTEESIQKLFNDVDINGDAMITCSEWVQYKVEKAASLARGLGRGKLDAARSFELQTDVATSPQSTIWDDVVACFLTAQYPQCLAMMRYIHFCFFHLIYTLAWSHFHRLGSKSREELQAVIGRKDHENNTLLHICAIGHLDMEDEMRGSFSIKRTLDPIVVEIIQFLLDCGLDASATNREGHTPRDVFLSGGAMSQKGETGGGEQDLIIFTYSVCIGFRNRSTGPRCCTSRRAFWLTQTWILIFKPYSGPRDRRLKVDRRILETPHHKLSAKTPVSFHVTVCASRRTCAHIISECTSHVLAYRISND